MATEIDSLVNVEITSGDSQQTADKIVGSLEKIDKSAKKVEASTKRLRDENGRFVKKGTEAYEKAARAAEKSSDKIVKSNRKSEESFKKTGRAASQSSDLVSTSANRALRSMIAYTAGVVGAGAAIRALITDYKEFETGLVGVAKTTGLAGNDLKEFAARIDEVSTRIPVSTNELLELAQAAGQMGVTGSKNLELFAVTIAKLGRASDLAGEDAAKSLARILNVTGEGIESIGTLGSVIVSLGNQIAATESEIALMTTEVARATSIFNITSAESAGLAAAMSSIGVQAALGGSSVGRAMRTISEAVLLGGKDLDEFTKSMGLNSEELKTAWADDKIGALMMFLEALNAQGEMAAITLVDIGLGGQQAAKTILPLANNIEILEKTLAIANKEVLNATALNREFEATLGTLDSQWKIFKGGVASASRAISGDFMPSLTGMIKSVNKFLQDGGVELVADGARSLAKVLKIGGILYLGLIALKGLFGGVSVSAALASGSITKLMLSLNLLIAAFAGWELGSFLSRNFAEARVAGAAFVVAMLNGFERLKAAGETMWIFFSGQFMIAAGDITRGYAKLLDAIAGGLDKVGLDTLAEGYRRFSENLKGTALTADDLKDSMKEVQAEMQENIDTNNQYLEDMITFEARIVVAAEVTDNLSDAQGELQIAVEGASETIDEGTEALIGYSEATMDVLDVLAEEVGMIGKSAEEQEIYNALKEAGVKATSEAGEAIIFLIGVLQDEEEAITAADDATKLFEKSQKELERESKRITKEMAKQWLSVRDTFSDAFVEMANGGENAFDSLAKSFKAMVLKMVADLAASKILDFFGFGGGSFGVANPGGILGGFLGGSGGTGGIGSSVLSGLIGGGAGGLTGNIGSLISAILPGGANTMASAGTAASGLFSGLGGAVTALASNPLTWGAAALLIAARNDFWKDPDGYIRTNSGLFVAPTPGAQGRGVTFDIDPFASGFQGQGFNKRGTQEEALSIINQFGAIDQLITDAVRLAGGTIDLSQATLNGINQEGQFGTSGTFLGVGGMTEDFNKQLDFFATQLADHIGGLSETILQELRAATSTVGIVSILERIIQENADTLAEAEAAIAASVAAVDAAALLAGQEAQAIIEAANAEAEKASKFLRETALGDVIELEEQLIASRDAAEAELNLLRGSGLTGLEDRELALIQARTVAEEQLFLIRESGLLRLAELEAGIVRIVGGGTAIGPNLDTGGGQTAEDLNNTVSSGGGTFPGISIEQINANIAARIEETAIANRLAFDAAMAALAENPSLEGVLALKKNFPELFESENIVGKLQDFETNTGLLVSQGGLEQFGLNTIAGISSGFDEKFADAIANPSLQAFTDLASNFPSLFSAAGIADQLANFEQTTGLLVSAGGLEAWARVKAATNLTLEEFGAMTKANLAASGPTFDLSGGITGVPPENAGLPTSPERGSILGSLANPLFAATGLSRVPRDGFIVSTHKDEEVLSANDPRNVNNSSSEKDGEMFSLLLMMANRVSIMEGILDKWDGQGMPPVRAQVS